MASDCSTIRTYFNPGFDQKKGTINLQKAQKYWQRQIREVTMERKLVLSSEDSERIRTWLSNQKWVDCEGRPVTLRVAPEEHLLGLIEE